MSALDTAEVIARVRDLPSLPVIVMELLDTIGKDDIDIRTLADKVSHDQALTAKTLRLANSSFYGLPRKVTTIAQAISVLGFQSVRTLITAAAVTGSFTAPPGSSFDFSSFWRHALGTAVAARSLARHAHVNVEFAFTAGLLHDLGRLVLVTCYPERYDEALAWRREQDSLILEAERHVLGTDHTVVGGALAEHWKFPSVIQKAVMCHHEPDAKDAGVLAAVIHVADAISHGLDLSADPADAVPPVSDQTWAGLALPSARLREILEEALVQFEEANQVLVA
jgi:putative nucleotidyltransferase with HDIG domain